MEKISIFVLESIYEHSRINFDYVVDLLAKNQDAKQIDIFISSYGGDVDEMVKLFEILRSHPAQKNTYYMGMNASAAISLGGISDKSYGTRRTTIMTHGVSGFMYGRYNEQELRTQADIVAKYTRVVASTLAAKTGEAEEYWIAELSKETYYSPEEALKAKIIDEIIDTIPFDFSAYAAMQEEEPEESDYWFFWDNLLASGDREKIKEAFFSKIKFDNLKNTDMKFINDVLKAFMGNQGVKVEKDGKAVKAEELATLIPENLATELEQSFQNEVTAQVNQATEALARTVTDLQNQVSTTVADLQSKLEASEAQNAKAVEKTATLEAKAADLSNKLAGLTAATSTPKASQQNVASTQAATPEKEERKEIGSDFETIYVNQRIVSTEAIDKVRQMANKIIANSQA